MGVDVPETRLKELYRAGVELDTIAEKMGVGRSTIFRRLDEYGIEQDRGGTPGQRVTVNCSYCGTEKNVIPSIFERQERFYCNQECLGNWRSENLTGEDAAGYKEKVEVSCEMCGVEFEVMPGRANRNNEHYCSHECSGQMVGEMMKDRVEVECDSCGQTLSRQKHRVDLNELNFCDMDCRGDWQSREMSGTDHPQWEGGRINRGEGWREIREKVRERDGNECQKCGVTSDFRKLDVHHIVRVRDFEDPTESHTMENCVQVCISCHSELESMDEGEQRKHIS